MTRSPEIPHPVGRDARSTKLRGRGRSPRPAGQSESQSHSARPAPAGAPRSRRAGAARAAARPFGLRDGHRCGCVGGRRSPRGRQTTGGAVAGPRARCAAAACAWAAWRAGRGFISLSAFRVFGVAISERRRLEPAAAGGARNTPTPNARFRRSIRLRLCDGYPGTKPENSQSY